jgi:hypothetical protein
VFQAFFVSYLVEPGYQKQMKTVDEIIDSELLYGFSSAIEMAAEQVDYKDHKRFPDSRRVKCDDLIECTKRMLIRRDIMTVCGTSFVSYIASTVGAGGSNVACYTDGSIFYLSCAALVTKGSPFFDRLNAMIRRCLEGGLVEKHWSEIIALTRLQNINQIPEDDNDMYFVFTISHLSTAFVIFTLGHLLSFVVFLCEIIYKWRCRQQI